MTYMSPVLKPTSRWLHTRSRSDRLKKSSISREKEISTPESEIGEMRVILGLGAHDNAGRHKFKRLFSPFCFPPYACAPEAISPHLLFGLGTYQIVRHEGRGAVRILYRLV